MERARGLFRFIWVPRILMVLFIIFLTLFSFDVFEMEGSIWTKVGAFVIHSVPSLVLAVVLVIAWRRPLIGGILVLACVAAFAVLSRIRSGTDFAVRQIIFNPVFIAPTVIGILFMISSLIEGSGESPDHSGGPSE